MTGRPEERRVGQGPVQPETVQVGRSGLTDAPPPLGRGWLVLSGLLVMTVIATVVIIGSDILGAGPDDERGDPDSAESSETRDATDFRPVADRGGVSRLTRATGTCRGVIRDERNADGTAEPRIPAAATDPLVVYSHEGADYAAVVVTDGGLTAWCAADDHTLTSGTLDTAAAAEPVRPYGRTPLTPGAGLGDVVVGEVTPDVEAVQIRVGDEPAGQAHVADGYFSAAVSAEPDAELGYLLTFADGRREAVDAPPLADAESIGRTNPMEIACYSYLNITVAEPEPDGNRSQADFDSDYDVVAEHTQTTYVLAAATDGETVTACLQASGVMWVASAPEKMPAGRLITPLQDARSSVARERTPLVGRAADSVTAVAVITADGQRIEAHLEDGFYAALVPAESAGGLTYDVQTQDGRVRSVEADG